MTDIRRNSLSYWFREWHGPLRRFLARRGVGSMADVDDVAQEVFLRLIQYNRADLIEFPQAYLYKIAANVSAEWASRSSRRLPHDSAWLADLADTLCPQDQLDREAADAELERALQALPSRICEILRLHFAEGLCRQEIARRLGVSQRVVKRDMERAYATLRMTLAADLFDSTEVAGQPRMKSHERR